MALTPLLFFTIPLAVAPLPISRFLPPFSPIRFFPFFPTIVLLSSISRELVWMILLLESIHTVLLQRNTPFFPLLLPSLRIWHWMRPNASFLLAASNDQRRHCGLLKWQKWQRKRKALLLLTAVMKSARLTSQPLSVPLPSSPKSRLRYGKRHPHRSKISLLYPSICHQFFP